MTGHSRVAVDFGGELNQRVVLFENPFPIAELKSTIHAASRRPPTEPDINNN